jgi:hypothetical protein
MPQPFSPTMFLHLRQTFLLVFCHYLNTVSN